MSRAVHVDVAGNRFYNTDCVAGARQYLADDSIDLIITDPPYGIEGDKLHQHYNRNEAYVTNGYVEVPAAEYGAFSKRWIAEAARVLRPGGQMYVVSGYTHLFEILAALRETNLEEINHIIWKYNFGVFTRQKFISSHYHILYYAKPGGSRTFNTECRFGLVEKTDENRSLNYEDREDVWIINREYKPGQVKNKNELPTALLAKMILYSSRPGDIVADFFLGGFSTARMAIGLGRRTTGFELAPEIFRQRVEDLKSIKVGSLLSEQRTPRIERVANQGARWTEHDVKAVLTRYRALSSHKNKAETISILSAEFGRGRFALEKLLKRQAVDQVRPAARPLDSFTDQVEEGA